MKNKLGYLKVVSYMNLRGMKRSGKLLARLYFMGGLVVGALFFGVTVYAAGIAVAGSGKTNAQGRQGAWTFEAPGGLAVWVACNYTDNVLEGDCIRYWPSSRTMASSGTYHGGLRSGIWNFYYVGGSVYAAGGYASGLRQGAWEWRYNTGEVMKTGSYHYGKRIGLWKDYSHTGEVGKNVFFDAADAAETLPLSSSLVQSLKDTFSMLDPTFSVEVSGDFVLASQVPLSMLEPLMMEQVLDWIPGAVRDRLSISLTDVKLVKFFLFLSSELFVDFCTQRYGYGENNKFLGGFYFPEERLLTLPFLTKNLAMTQGTLAHELVHAVLRDDFPAVPHWFNEGMASLYENVANVDGAARAFPHERLDYLRERADAIQPLGDIMRMNKQEFSNASEDDPVLNYAFCRFVCYYLQEKGKLAKFYSEMKAQAAADPRGIATLPRVLGLSSVDEVHKAVISYSLGIDLKKFRLPKGTKWVIKD